MAGTFKPIGQRKSGTRSTHTGRSCGLLNESADVSPTRVAHVSARCEMTWPTYIPRTCSAYRPTSTRNDHVTSVWADLLLIQTCSLPTHPTPMAPMVPAKSILLSPFKTTLAPYEDIWSSSSQPGRSALATEILSRIKKTNQGNGVNEWVSDRDQYYLLWLIFL